MSTTNEQVLTHHSTSEEVARVVDHVHGKYEEMCEELSGTIVGMKDVTEQLMIGILCRGHCILQGMPGLAKTLLISQLASLMDLSFHRIQFTPDLMPADITGGDVLEEDRTTGKRVFRFLQGPAVRQPDPGGRNQPHAAEDAKRTAWKRWKSGSSRSAGTTYPLPEPFFVLATQNPIEVEGTYPLPEAQLDRFLMKIKVNYPSRADEWEICRRQTTDYSYDIEHVIDVQTLLQMQSVVPKVIVADHVYEAAIDLARMTRPEEGKLAGRAARQGAVRRGPPGKHRPALGRQGPRPLAQAVPRDDRRHLRGGAAGACGIALFPRSTPKRPGSIPTRSSKRSSSGTGLCCADCSWDLATSATNLRSGGV